MPEDKHALSKNQRRKLKKRAGGGPSAGTSKELILDAIRRAGAGGAAEDDASGVDVEYVSAEYAGEEEEDEAMREFRDVFSKFAKPEGELERSAVRPPRLMRVSSRSDEPRAGGARAAGGVALARG